jgi:hypothetical protein
VRYGQQKSGAAALMPDTKQANEPIHEENKTGDKQNNLGGIETRRPNPRAEIGGKLQQQDPIRKKRRTLRKSRTTVLRERPLGTAQP